MSDTVEVLETSRNALDIETEIQQFLDTADAESVDDVELLKRGRNRVLITITYTAAAE